MSMGNALSGIVRRDKCAGGSGCRREEVVGCGSLEVDVVEESVGVCSAEVPRPEPSGTDSTQSREADIAFARFSACWSSRRDSAEIFSCDRFFNGDAVPSKPHEGMLSAERLAETSS